MIHNTARLPLPALISPGAADDLRGGIVEGGTKSSTQQLPTQAAKTVTPGTAAQPHAIQRGHPNGDMEAALAYTTDIKHKIKDHLTTIGVHSLIDD